MDRDNSILCAYCGKTFCTNSNLRRHVREKHKSITESPDEVERRKELQCVLCDRQYTRKFDLKHHVNTVHISMSDNSKLNNCPMCSYSTAHKNALTRHIKNIHIFKHKQTKKTTIECIYCEETFSQQDDLTSHVQMVHENATGDLAEVKCISSEKEKKTCAVCGKQYSRKKDLERHIRSIHHPSSDGPMLNKCLSCSYTTSFKSHLIRHIKTAHANGRKKHDTYGCDSCKSSFNHKRALRYHITKYHASPANSDKPVLKRTCCLCSKTLYGYSLEAVRSHLENVHNIPMKWEFHTFNSFTEFETWKKSIERKTTSSYVLNYVYKSIKTYKCHRSGNYKRSGHNKRKMKVTGSCKINNICPSFIKVKVEENNISVKYLPTHVGHENELKHLHLTPEERQAIAKQLIRKVPHDVVITKIRRSAVNSDLQRIHLIKKKDIFNIAQSSNLMEKVIKDKEDINIAQTSNRIENVMKDVEEESPVYSIENTPEPQSPIVCEIEII